MYIRLEGLKHYFTPRDVTVLYKAQKGKYAVVDFLTGYYQKVGVKEKIDSNELNLIADFHWYNLEFAKEKLLLSDEKTALLLNIFAMLIAFKDYEAGASPTKAEARGKEEPQMSLAISVPQTAGEVNEEEEHRQALEQKYDVFTETMMIFATDNPPSSLRVFSADEVKKALDYALSSYFRHFRLYNDVLSNKQLSDQKSILVYIDEPLHIPPLSEGLVANHEREELEGREDEAPECPGSDPKDQVEAKRLEDGKDLQPDPAQPSKPNVGPERKDLAEPAAPSRKMDKESQALIASKMQEFKNELEATITQRDKALLSQVEAATRSPNPLK